MIKIQKKLLICKKLDIKCLVKSPWRFSFVSSKSQICWSWPQSHENENPTSFNLEFGGK